MDDLRVRTPLAGTNSFLLFRLRSIMISIPVMFVTLLQGKSEINASIFWLIHWSTVKIIGLDYSYPTGKKMTFSLPLLLARPSSRIVLTDAARSYERSTLSEVDNKLNLPSGTSFEMAG